MDRSHRGLHHSAHVRRTAVAAERSSAKRDIAAGRRRMARSGEPPRSIGPNDSNRPYRGRARCPHRAAIAPKRILRFQTIAGHNPQPLFTDDPTPTAASPPPTAAPKNPPLFHLSAAAQGTDRHTKTPRSRPRLESREVGTNHPLLIPRTSTRRQKNNHLQRV